MDTKQFLSHVLSGTGRYCLVTVKHTKDKAVRGALTHTFFNSIDELSQAATIADTSKLDAYFALGTIGEENNRKAYNIQEFKTFFLDIDCGEGKDYPDKVTAFKALKAFRKKYGLPKPIIVDSGNGLHVYWVLSSSVVASEWKPVADRLKQACKDFGLRADEAVTSDIARILRVPGTHNHKSDPIPVQVQGQEEPELTTIEEFNKCLGGLGLIPVTNLPVGMTKRELDPLTEHYTRNMESSFKKILKRTMAGDGCAQIKNRLETKTEASYEEWVQMLALAWQCNDRDKAVQIVSSGYADYDPDVARAKAATFDGPTLCSTFENTTPGLCAGCPHQGQIKSPIQLGKEITTVEQEVVVVEPEPVKVSTGDYIKAEKGVLIPKFPNGYARGQNGGVYMKITDQDGNVEHQLVYLYDLYVHATMKASYGHVAIVREHSPHDGMQEFSIPFEHLTSQDELRKHLSRNNIVADTKKIMHYLTAWLGKLKAERKAVEAKEQFGWSEDNTSFTWGDWTYHKDAEPTPNLPARQTAEHVPAARPMGSEQRWHEIISYFNYAGQEAHRALVLSAFAAPLMKFTGINLASANFYTTDSGVGKTTGLYAGLAAFGKPEALQIKAKDTHNANQMILQTYKNMLAPMDELSNKNAMYLSNMIYENSDGQIKNRMRSSGNELRHRGEPWYTLLVSTSNESILDIVTSAKAVADAEAQRMIEIHVPKVYVAPKEETDALFHDIKVNYGHVGGQYLQHLVDNAEDIRKGIVELQTRIDTAAGLKAENRFWSAWAACNLLACHICNKLGILPFSAKEQFNWTVKTLIKARDRVATMKASDSPQALISRFLDEHINSIISITSTEDMRGVHDNGLDSIVVPHLTPKASLVGRWETDTNVIFISASAIKAWCMKDTNRINYTDLRDKTETELDAKVRGQKKRLSKGTYLSGGPVNVWAIPADKLHLEELPDAGGEGKSNIA
jgi:DNA primase